MAGHGTHAHPSPDVSIDYFAAGEGRPLALVHGITESRRTWDPLLAPLIAAGYRVIAVDLRGHGGSSRVAPYDLATMAGDLAALSCRPTPPAARAAASSTSINRSR